MNSSARETGENSSHSHKSAAGGSYTPQPVERLHVSPFLTKAYDLVDDPSTNQVVSWSQDNGSSSFVIWDPRTFSSRILPRYFKHNNFANFVRQLNTYGFKKVNPDRWEFANEGFIRGERHLIKNNMKRRGSQAQPSQQPTIDPCPKFEESGLDKEVHRLRRDKEILMTELVKLRQCQKTTKAYIRSMELRLRKTELKQEQTTRFLAKAVRNPEFMQRLSQVKESREKHGYGPFRDDDQGPSNAESIDPGPGTVIGSTMNFDFRDYDDISEYEVSDVDIFAMNALPSKGRQEHEEQLLGDFLNDWIEEEMRTVNVEGDDEYAPIDELNFS